MQRFGLCISDVQRRIVACTTATQRVRYNVETLLLSRAHLPCPIPTFAAQLLPHKFGDTRDCLPLQPQDHTFTKHGYSMALPHVVEQLRSEDVTDVVLTGFETHWCITASAHAFVSHGFRVVIPHDCVASQHDADHDIALKQLQADGVRVSSRRAVLAALVGEDMGAAAALIKHNFFL